MVNAVISCTCSSHLSLCPGMDSEDLKVKAKELWDLIVKLETERYDLEERTRRQDYDVNLMQTPTNIQSIKIHFSLKS